MANEFDDIDSLYDNISQWANDPDSDLYYKDAEHFGPYEHGEKQEELIANYDLKKSKKKTSLLGIEKIYPFRRKSKWGFANNQKKLLTGCIYDEVHFHSEEIIFVKMANSWAVFDESGRNLSDFRFISLLDCEQYINAEIDKAIEIVNKIDPIVTISGQKYFFTNDTGNRIIDLDFDFAESFINELAIVKVGPFFGVINKLGNFIIPIKFYSIKNTLQGTFLANYSLIFDYSGNLISKFDYISSFVDGFAIIGEKIETRESSSNAKDYKFGLINAKGEISFPCTFKSYYFPEYRNGYLIFLHEDSGFIIVNEDGKVENVITYSNQHILDFLIYYSEQFIIRATVKDEWLEERLYGEQTYPRFDYSIINHRGELISPKTSYEEISLEFNLLHMIEGINYGLFSVSGAEVIECQYEEILDSSEAPYAVRQNEKWGFVDSKNNVIAPFIFDNVTAFTNGISIVGNNNQYNLINSEGRIFTNTYYVEIKELTSDYYKVRINTKWSILCVRTGEVFPSEYDEIAHMEGGSILVRTQKHWGVLSNNLEIILETEFDKIQIGQLADIDIFELAQRKNAIKYENCLNKSRIFFLVSVEKYFGLYEHEKEILAPIYDEIIICSYYVLYKKESKWGYLISDLRHDEQSEIFYDKIFTNIEIVICINYLNNNCEVFRHSLSCDYRNHIERSSINTRPIARFDEAFEYGISADIGLVFLKFRNPLEHWLLQDFYDDCDIHYGNYGHFSEVIASPEGWIFVKYDLKWGFLKHFNDHNFGRIFDYRKCIYEKLVVLDKNYVIASCEGKYGVLNRHGGVIIPFVFAELKKASSKYLYAKSKKYWGSNNDGWGVISINGDIVIDFTEKEEYLLRESFFYNFSGEQFLDDPNDSIRVSTQINLKRDDDGHNDFLESEQEYRISGNKRSVHMDFGPVAYIHDKEMRIGLSLKCGTSVIPTTYDTIELRKDGLLKVGKYFDYYMDSEGVIFKD